MNPQTRLQARLWLALVFFLGSAIGIAFGYTFAHRSYASTTDPQMSEPERRAKRVAEMTREINLTLEQSQKLDAIFLAAHTEMRRLHDKSDADMEAIRQKARNDTRAFLTDEQKPKFEAFVQKLDAERKKQMPSPH
jgi:Spy/CpxP family protein refolding chaperone